MLKRHKTVASVVSGGENGGHNVRCTDGFPFPNRVSLGSQISTASLKSHGLVGYNCFQPAGSTSIEL